MERDLPQPGDLDHISSDIERCLLSDYREPFQFWVPTREAPEQWALEAYARQDGSVCSLFYPERNKPPQNKGY